MTGKDLVPRPAALPAAMVAAPPFEQPKRRTESGARLLGRALRRNRHVTVPLALPFVFWPGGLILHHYHAAGFVLGIGLLVAVLVGYFAPSKWDRRSEQWYACATVSAGMTWLWLAAWLDPVRGPITAIVLGSLLLAGCIAWGIPWWKHHRPRGRRKREALIAKWDGWWQSHAWAWNLGGSAITGVWIMGVTTKVEVAGLAGRHTKAHVDQVLPLIESGLDGFVDVGRVRVETVPGRPNHFWLFLKQANPLAQVVEWDPSIAPQSVHEPAPEGLTESGSWKMTSLRKNAFVIGETRSGKSNRLLVRLACLSGCRDARPVLIDLKGGRSGRPVLEAAAAEYVITEVDEARMYLRMLLAEARARQKYAYTGHEQLEADEETPSIHTMIDEVHGLTSVANGDAECSSLLALVASQGAGVEEYEEVYTQYGALEESVRSEQTRGNLLLRLVFRVAMAAHGQFAIEEWNRLDASKLEEVGTCYIKDGPKALAEQVRTPRMAHDLFKRIAAQNAALLGDRPPLRLWCGGEQSPAGVTWQQWWDTRWLRLDPAFHGISPQYQAAIADHPHAVAGVLADAAESIAPPPSEPGTGDGRAVAARIEAELPGVPDGFRPSPVDLRPVIIRQRAAFAQALAGAAERGGITPKQLADESGMSTSWIHPMLKALADREAVTQLKRGLYAPLPGADIPAAMGKVQADRDRLLGEAREKINAA
jgi:hypothetical protein